MYSSFTKSWIYISDLFAPRSTIAVAVLSLTEFLVVGGVFEGKRENTVANCQCMGGGGLYGFQQCVDYTIQGFPNQLWPGHLIIVAAKQLSMLTLV